ncbi:hypothetical protein [Paracoccus yeei]|uniref:hypothetical protein n=1 Tax=Paracoccus yeei TaxID=147645 RepID=UPI003B8A5B8D
MQADAYGCNDLYRADRDREPCPAQVLRACRHQGDARKRKHAHDISPVALKAVTRMDAIFDIERSMADPDHEQHQDMIRWSDGDFDTEDADIDSIIRRFDRLAKK